MIDRVFKSKSCASGFCVEFDCRACGQRYTAGQGSPFEQERICAECRLAAGDRNVGVPVPVISDRQRLEAAEAALIAAKARIEGLPRLSRRQLEETLAPICDYFRQHPAAQ